MLKSVENEISLKYSNNIGMCFRIYPVMHRFSFLLVYALANKLKKKRKYFEIFTKKNKTKAVDSIVF